MIHDKKKINAIIEENGFDTYFDQIKSAMEEYAEHIRQKTIDEAIGCVANGTFPTDIEKWNFHNNGFNDCRNQTITNLEKLK